MREGHVYLENKKIKVVKLMKKDCKNGNCYYCSK